MPKKYLWGTDLHSKHLKTLEELGDKHPHTHKT